MGTTTNYGWVYPADGGNADTWGAILDTMFVAQDASLKAVDTAAQGYATTAQGNAQGTSLQKAANLSDLASLAVALGNMGFVGDTGTGYFTVNVNMGGTPRKVYVQWMEASVANGTTTYSWPIAFPNACLTALSGYSSNTASGDRVIWTYSRTATQVTITNNGNSSTVVTLGIGY